LISHDVLAPLKNHEGVDTPSIASRLWFLLIMALSVISGWLISEGDWVMTGVCTVVFATLLLNIGWIFIGRMSDGREPILLSKSLSSDSEKNGDGKE